LDYLLLISFSPSHTVLFKIDKKLINAYHRNCYKVTECASLTFITATICFYMSLYFYSISRQLHCLKFTSLIYCLICFNLFFNFTAVSIISHGTYFMTIISHELLKITLLHVIEFVIKYLTKLGRAPLAYIPDYQQSDCLQAIIAHI